MRRQKVFAPDSCSSVGVRVLLILVGSMIESAALANWQYCSMDMNGWRAFEFRTKNHPHTMKIPLLLLQVVLLVALPKAHAIAS